MAASITDCALLLQTGNLKQGRVWKEVLIKSQKAL